MEEPICERQNRFAVKYGSSEKNLFSEKILLTMVTVCLVTAGHCS